MQTITHALFGLICLFMMITPVAILLLVRLSIALSLGIVVVFGGIFVVILSVLKAELVTMLFGSSAYIAVMATFLSNLHFD
jgi:hypothetical protein